METTTKLSAPVLALALQILNGYRARWTVYLESCEMDRKDGYTPHYCFHGMSRWTDYDNICGQCEDTGNYWSYELYARISLDEAIRRHAQMMERQDVLCQLLRMGAPATEVLALGDWSMETMKV